MFKTKIISPGRGKTITLTCPWCGGTINRQLFNTKEGKTTCGFCYCVFEWQEVADEKEVK